MPVKHTLNPRLKHKSWCVGGCWGSLGFRCDVYCRERNGVLMGLLMSRGWGCKRWQQEKEMTRVKGLGSHSKHHLV
jgi:hypothetical protein